MPYSFTTQTGDDLVASSDINAIQDAIENMGTGSILVAASNAPQKIKDRADYLCDGSNDDVQIQAALDISRSVVLSEGLFTISSKLQISNHGQKLMGQGKGQVSTSTDTGGGTIIQLDPNLGDYSALENDYLLDIDDFGAGTTCRARVLLKDFCIHGRGMGTAINGIHFRSHQGVMENVVAISFTANGIYVEGFTGWQTYETRLINCEGNYCGVDGIHLASYSADLHLLHCVAHDNSNAGLYAGGASHQVTGLHVYANTNYGIYATAGCSNLKLIGCKIEHNQIAGVYIFGSAGTQIVGCGFKGGQQNAPDGTGASLIKLTNSCQGVTIVGNRFQAHDDGNDTSEYGIDIDGNYTNVIIADNNVGGGYRTGPIRFGSTRSNIRIDNNTGIITWAANTFNTDGNTAYTISHGLTVTPFKRDVFLSPQGNIGTGVVWWVSAVSATTFTVNFSAAVTGVTISWKVESQQ